MKDDNSGKRTEVRAGKSHEELKRPEESLRRAMEASAKLRDYVESHRVQTSDDGKRGRR